MYDRKMRLETEYQIMEFKIKKAELFRDDVRDIIGLTSVKMDTYLIVNAVQLGFCVMMFCEGRLAAGTPNWLIGCHTLALAGAFTYLLMSVWLSMHATIAAKSYEVRLLTQLVRLPVPSWAELEGARTYASTFEKMETRQMFRVPFATGSQEGVLQYAHGGTATGGETEHLANADDIDFHGAGPMITDGAENISGEDRPTASASGAFSSDPWGLERPGDSIYELDGSVQTDPRNLRHIQLVREAMQYWQSYDAFSRVSMSIGTNQLVTALAYYVLGYVLVSNHAIVASWLAVVLFMAIACALIRLDMSLTAAEYRTAVVLVLTGPICTAISTKEWAQYGTDVITNVCMPIAYVSHALWLVFILYLSKTREQKNGVQLPTGFRSVLYIDVFGWIKDNPVQKIFTGLARPTERTRLLPSANCTAAAGPALQSVRYVDGRPVPMRVEQLPGASSATRATDINKADFAPDTFVPREKDGDDAQALDASEVGKAGARPWMVFCGATSLLAILWWVTGMVVCMELLGVGYLKVVPLTREEEHSVVQDNATKFLQLGQVFQTHWPHENVHASGLACNSASRTVIASTRFGLYAADFSNELNSQIQFKTAPECQDIEGESLQDVSLSCGPDGGACQAVVLHQQGRQLANCDVTKKSNNVAAGKVHSPVSFIAEEWLDDGDADGKAAAENVQSLAMSSECTGGARSCAYIGTSSERVVEMQQPPQGGADRKYFPHRLLQAKMNGTSSMSMDVVHDRYLALLQRDGQHVQVLDLEKGGAVIDTWNIPKHPAHESWSAMCASGDNLYLLSGGRSPQLWSFPVPSQLQKMTKKSQQREVEAAGTAPASDNILLQQKFQLHGPGVATHAVPSAASGSSATPAASGSPVTLHEAARWALGDGPKPSVRASRPSLRR